MMKTFTLIWVLLLGQLAFAGSSPAKVTHNRSYISWQYSTDKQDFISKVKTYPNPIADRLTIEFPAEVKIINVFSLIGNKITEVNVTDVDHTQINFDGMPSGYYILQFTDENGRNLGTIKVVKK